MLDREFVLPHMIALLADAEPGAIALQNVDGAEMTRRAHHEGNLRWAGAYRGAGVQAGDHVVTMFPNSFDAYFAWLGLAWLRAVEVPANNAYRGQMLAYVVDNCDARAVALSERFVPQLVEIAADLPQVETVIVPDATGDAVSALEATGWRIVTGEEFFAGAASDVSTTELDGPDPWDIAAMIYTSGTTGPSKGVLVPWGTLWSFGSSGPDRFVEPGEGIYGMYPAFHVSGKAMLYQAARYRARLVVREQFSITNFLDDCRHFEITGAGLVGPMAPFLLSLPESPDDATTPLRHVTMGPLVPEVDEFKRRFGVEVATGYGMTEIGAPFMSDGYRLPNNRSCGKLRDCWAGYEVRVVDAHDQPLGPDQVGELIVRTDEPWVLNSGYYGMPEASAAAWRNGWFHTGDGFRYDTDGNFYFVDRMKDAIRRRGENISSFEVEGFVSQHPEVMECAVIGVPSEYTEDEVKVFVVRQANSQLAPDDLVRWLAPRMPKFMVPRYVEFVDALPKTEATMRTQKVKLRDQALNEHTWDREAAGIVIG